MKSLILASTLVAAVFCHESATAQVQNKEQQACVNGMNKGMAKVAGLSSKLFTACNTAQAKGDTPSAPSCALADPKLAELTTKICEAQTDLCTTVPGFGFTDCTYIGGFGPYAVAGVWMGLFGAEAGVTVCDTDKDGCQCQGKVLKSALKVYATYLKNFNACKKSGLRSDDAPIVGVAGLQACFGLDPKETILKANTKLAGTIAKSCEGVATPFSQGDCSGLVGDPLSQCVARVARCHSCRIVSASDNLGIDCDLVDDAVDNDTCF
jgi:hypothetical protein